MSKSKSRTIRIFISSTFRDMQAERDELTQRIFPELRARCRERNLNLVEVDLRWGITEEQEKQGRVLSLCLEQIDQSRPYFIGLLGDRYGTVPEIIDEKLLQQYPWLRDNKEKSLTELEMLHGVLYNITDAGNAYFYFRSPGYYQGLSSSESALYIEEDQEKGKKQQDLKERILKEGLHVYDGYVHPRELGEHVLSDIWSSIDKQFPESDTGERQLSLIEDSDAFENIASDIYVDREEEEKLYEMLQSSDLVAIVGDTGSGKTELLNNWLRKLSERHQEYFTIEYYSKNVDHGYSPDLMIDHFVSRVAAALKSSIDPGLTLESRLKTFEFLLLKLKEQTNVLIGIDSLDEYYRNDNSDEFRNFWKHLPVGVKVVCTLNDQTVLERSGNREWTLLPMAPLTFFQREIIITQYLLRYGKQLSPDRTTKLSRNPLCANPLFLRTILEELRVDAKHEELDQKIDSFTKARDLSDLFSQVIDSYQVRSNRMYPGVLEKVLCYITLVQNGLTERELLELLNASEDAFTYHDWSVVFLTLQETLRIRSGRIVFKHSFFLDIVRQKFFKKNAEFEYRKDIIAFFKKQEPDIRNILELAFQFSAAEQWEDLHMLLTQSDIYRDALTGDFAFDFVKYFLSLDARFDLQQSLNAIFARFEKAQPLEEEKLEFLNTLGRFAYILNKPEIAIHFLQESLVLTRNIFGWDHESTVLKMKSLGEAMIDGGDPIETRLFFRQILALCHKKYGFESRITSKVFSGLTECYARLNDPMTEEFYIKALEVCKKVYGDNHQETSILIDNMANFLESRGSVEENIELHKEALEISINTVGLDHIDTAKCRDNLARAFIKAESWSEGLHHAQKALEVFGKHLGEDHKDTQIALFNTYIAYRNSGDFIRAAQTLIRSLNSKNIIEHYSFEWITNELRDLSSYLAYSGHFAEAEEARLRLNELVQQNEGISNVQDKLALANINYEKGVYQEAFNNYKEILNEPISDDEDEAGVLCQCYIGMAKCTEETGHVEEAANYLKQALELTNDCEKDRDLLRVECYNRLSVIYMHQGELEIAGEFCDNALILSEQLHGKDSFLTANIYNLKGQVEISRKNTEEAKMYMQKSYDLSLEAQGEKHPATITCLNNLSYAVKESGDFAKAEELITRVIELRLEILGRDHPGTGNSINMLAELYFEKGDFEKAEKEYGKVVQLLPRDHKNFRVSWSEKSLLIVECKQEQKKYSEAIEICNEVIELNRYEDEKAQPLLLTAHEKNYKSYSVLNDFELAEKTAESILQLFAKNGAASNWESGHWHVELATSIVNQGRINDALVHYELGLDILLKTAGPEHHLTQQAKKLLEQNVEFSRNEIFYRSYIMLSRAENYLLSAKIDHAKEIVNTVISICNDDFDQREIILGKAYSALGSVCLKEADYPRAIEAYKTALSYGKKNLGEEHPEIITHFRNLAYAFMSNADFEDAILIYEDLISQRGVEEHLKVEDLMYFFRDFIYCLLKIGNENRAIEIVILTFEYFESNLKDVDYESYSVFLMLSKVFRENSSPEVERTMLEKIIEKVPPDSRFWVLWGMVVYYNLAVISQRTGDISNSIASYEKVIAKEYNIGGGPESFVERMESGTQEQDIPENFGQEWINSLYYLIFYRDIPNAEWNAADRNYILAQKLLHFNQNKNYSLALEYEYCARLVENGRTIEVEKVHESVEMYMLSGNINRRVNTGISALGLSFRSQNNLVEAEYFSMKALDLDSHVLEKNDPSLSVKLRNVAIIMLLRNKYEEAVKYSTMGWQILGGNFDLVSARLLVIRVVIGIMTGKKYTDYLGQLKSLLETNAGSIDRDTHPQWEIQVMIDFLMKNRLEEDAGFVASLVDVINLKKDYSVLLNYKVWKDQDMVPLNIPWPAEGY